MAKAEVVKYPAKKMNENIKKLAWSAILESLIMVILGIFLITWPDAVVKIIAYVVGIFFIIKGAYQVISYFIVKGQEDFFNNNLLGGVVSVLIGLALLLIGEELANVFRVVIGIWMIYEALVRISTVVKLHAAKIAAWKYILILALMMLVAGVFVVFYKGAVITLIGWMMILTGIIGVVGDVMFIQYVNTIADKLTGKQK